MSLKYKIALCNVFWSEDGIDTRYFSTISDQNSYFDTLTSGLFSPLVNFEMGNNIQTSIVYTDKSLRDGSTLCKCNYAVVLKTEIDENEQETILERRYFFAYPSQVSGSKMKVRLSLDDIQTNYFAHKSTIAPCFIKKAHLNRFIQDPDHSHMVLLNTKPDSPLFERETTSELSKRLVLRKKLKLKVFEDTTLNNWYNDNVIGWVYIYLDKNHKYKFFDPTYTNPLDSNDHVNSSEYAVGQGVNRVYGQKTFIEGCCGVLAYPICKDGKYIRCGYGNSNTQYITISASGFNSFRNNNSYNSYIKSIKFSILPPHKFTATEETKISIDTISTSQYLTIGWGFDIQESPLFAYGIRGFEGISGYTLNSSSNGSGVLRVVEGFTFECIPYNMDNSDQNFTLNYTKEYIKQTTGMNFYTSAMEPKMRGMDFVELRITNERGQYFSYDIEKLNQSQLVFEYSEPLSPDITRSYTRLKGLSNSLYIEDTKQNLTGLVDSADMSLMVDNDQLSQMLSQNKNFYLQNALDIWGKGLFSGVIGSFKANPIGIASGVGGVLSGYINQNLTIDNLKNSPHQLINSNGNAYFNAQYTEPGLYIEFYKIIPQELNSVYKTINLEGMTYNQIDSLSNVDNIRKRFNYIEANVEGITAPISNEEKNRLRQRLSKIRFWNDESLNDYTKNYERWLDNE